MTEAEYLDPEKWPLSTQTGLKLRDQQMLDAFAYDHFKQMLEQGRPLTPAQQASMAEIEQKTARWGK